MILKRINFMAKIEEALTRDQAGIYVHINGTGLKGRRNINSQGVKDNDAELQSDPDVMRTRWLRFCSPLLKVTSDTTKSEYIDSLERIAVDATLGELFQLCGGWSTRCQRWQTIRRLERTTFLPSY